MDEIAIDTVTLDSAVKMLKLTYSLELWDQLIDLSDKLFIRANHLYENRANISIRINTERPLVYYYGYSLLMKGLAYKELGNYDSALQCIDEYSNLYWFDNLSEEGLKEVDYYQFISAPNRFEVLLLSGDFSILDAYVEFLTNNRNEILPGTISILKAANTYQHNINYIIDTFSQEIIQSISHSPQDIIHTAYYQSFLMQIIKYKIDHSDHIVAIDYTLQLMFSSHLAANDRLYKYAVVCFESIRDYATQRQLDTFKDHIAKIMGEGKVVI